MENPTDEEILKSAQNIAVVGLSDKPGRDRSSGGLSQDGLMCDGQVHDAGAQEAPG